MRQGRNTDFWIWIIVAAAALGPIYWLPFVPRQGLYLVKVALIFATFGSLLHQRRIYLNKVDIILFLVIAIVMLFSEIVVPNGAGVSLLLMFAFFFFGFIFSARQTPEALIRLVFLTGLAFSVFPMLVIFDFLAGGLFYNPLYEIKYPLFASGFQGGRTGWAFYTNLYAALLIGTLGARRGPRRKYLVISAVLIMVVNNLLVGSRGGILIGVALLIILVFMLGRKRSSRLAMALVVIAIGAFGVALAPSLLASDSTRIFMLLNNGNVSALFDASSRVEGYRISLDILSQSPLLGYGRIDLQTFGLAYSSIHNVWLRLAVERGVPLFLLILAFLVRLIARARRVEKTSGLRSVAYLALFVVFFGGLVEPTIVFGNFYSSFFFWFLMGAISRKAGFYSTLSLSRGNRAGIAPSTA